MAPKEEFDDEFAGLNLDLDDDNQDPGQDQGEASDLSDEALARATALGWSEVEVKAKFRDDAGLHAALDFFVDTIGATAPAPQGNPAPQGQGQGQPAQPPAPFKLEGLEDLDPEVGKLLTKMHEHYAGQLQTLQQQVVAAQQAGVSESEEQFWTGFDKALVGMGKDFQALFGTQPIEQLADTSLECQNRQRVAQEVQRLRLGLRAQGRRAPEPAVLAREAVRKVFPQQTAAAAAQQLDQAAEKVRDKRTGRFSRTARPSGRRGAERTDNSPSARESRGTQTIKDWAKRSGFSLSD